MTKFHFSGICGTGMGNVAMLLAKMGHEVKGSDENFFPPMGGELESAGIHLMKGYRAENISAIFTPDVQVLANVMSKDHIEAVAGRKGPWQVMSFPEVLEKYLLQNRESFVVAGTHGKTSTSSMLAKIFEPDGGGWLIGGVFKDGQPGYRAGEEEKPFVIEGDEYDTAWFDKHSKFLHYKPKHLLLTHLEWDHVDIFPEFEKMLDEFRELLKLVPKNAKVVYCAEVDSLCELIAQSDVKGVRYGSHSECDYRLVDSQKKGESHQLTFLEPSGESFEIITPLPGRIYHLNLLGAYASAREWGKKPEDIAKALKNFEGMKRRLEILKDVKGYTFYSDFAHHPTAIHGTLELLRNEHPNKKILAIFDPRNATSRRKTFASELSEALSLADRVILGPVYPDKRLSEEEKLDVKALVQDLGSGSIGCLNVDELYRAFSSPPSEEIVVAMSCGAFHGIIQKLAESNDGSLLKA